MRDATKTLARIQRHHDTMEPPEYWDDHRCVWRLVRRRGDAALYRCSICGAEDVDD